MTTLLTWCEDCGDDMREFGGRSCRYCGREFCFVCMREHERDCRSTRRYVEDDI